MIQSKRSGMIAKDAALIFKKALVQSTGAERNNVVTAQKRRPKETRNVRGSW